MKLSIHHTKCTKIHHEYIGPDVHIATHLLVDSYFYPVRCI